MKFILLTFIFALAYVARVQAANEPENIYGFSVLDIDGNNVTFDKYKDKVLIIMNVASECTLTETNYKQMNELYEKYQSKGLRILAFPSNTFFQEPGSNADVKKFAESKDVKFDLFSKVDVNGDSTPPIYAWLKSKQPGFLGTTAIKWNFTKFLVSRKGVPVARYSPTTSPASIEEDIKKQLDA